MENEELLKKDLQLLVAKATINQLAAINTMLNNQAAIISHLKDIPFNDVVKQIRNNIDNNFNDMSEQIKNGNPNISLKEIRYN